MTQTQTTVSGWSLDVPLHAPRADKSGPFVGATGDASGRCTSRRRSSLFHLPLFSHPSPPHLLHFLFPSLIQYPDFWAALPLHFMSPFLFFFFLPST